MRSKGTRNSMLCPNCRKLISRDVARCPFCRTAKPGSWVKNNPIFASFTNEDRLINVIMYTNIIMFVISLLFTRHGAMSLSPFSFLSPGNNSLLMLGSTGTIPVFRLHRWWSLLAANYLHGSLMHILFNMIALKQIAPLVAQEYGGWRMLIIYTLGGVLGFVVSTFAGVPLTIGASAAVCALIGAILFYGKSRGGIYGQELFRRVGGWAVSIFVFGFLVPGINNWGHGGGMAAGALLGYLLGYNERRKQNIRHKFIALICILATAFILFFYVFSATIFVLR